MAVSREIALAGKFLTESLTKYDLKLIDTEYPEYWAADGRYHNAIADLPFGVKQYTQGRVDYTGRAVNYGGKATTMPLANFGIQMDGYKCMTGVLAADWTWEELRAEEASQGNAFMPTVNVIQSYNEALTRGLREWMHIRAVFGDPSQGFAGLLTNPYVDVEDVDAATFLGAAVTAAGAYDFFRTELSEFRQTSRLTSQITGVLTSEAVQLKLTARYGDGSSDGTPLGTLLGGGAARSPVLQQFDVINEASVSSSLIADFELPAALSGAGREWALFYELSPDNMVRHYADMDFSEPFMLDDGMTFRRIGLCATSEVIYTRPYRAKLYRFATS